MRRLAASALAALAFAGVAQAQTVAPKVVSTFPPAGAVVPAGIDRVAVTYDRRMQDGSWSFVTGGEQKYPEVAGQPAISQDHMTFVLPVKLRPNATYVMWFNGGPYQNFKDEQGQSAEPFRLTFSTSE